MTPPDVTRQIVDAVAAGRNPHLPEAVSVLVVTADEATALLVAPTLASRLYPDRRFGQPLHAEWLTCPAPGWAVAVAVLP